MTKAEQALAKFLERVPVSLSTFASERRILHGVSLKFDRQVFYGGSEPGITYLMFDDLSYIMWKHAEHSGKAGTVVEDMDY